MTFPRQIEEAETDAIRSRAFIADVYYDVHANQSQTHGNNYDTIDECGCNDRCQTRKNVMQALSPGIMAEEVNDLVQTKILAQECNEYTIWKNAESDMPKIWDEHIAPSRCQCCEQLCAQRDTLWAFIPVLAEQCILDIPENPTR